MKRNIFCLFLLLNVVLAYSQQKPATSFVIVTGRVLSPEDSALVKDWFFEGLKAKTIENNELAEEYFKRIIGVDPANDAALYQLAILNLQKNQSSEAEHFAREAVTVNPDNEWYWVLLADIYKKDNNVEALSPVFDELIRLKPGKEEYYLDKAKTLILQGKNTEAAALYDSIEKKFGPDDAITGEKQSLLLKQGNPQDVIRQLEKQLKANPEEIRNYILLAQLYDADKRSRQAMQLLLKAKKIDPHNPFVRLALADLYHEAGKNTESFTELKTAFSNPDLDIDTKVRIVLSYFPRFSDSRERNRAEELASDLVKQYPAEPKALSMYGDVLFQQKKIQEAASEYRKAVLLSKNVYLIWEQLLRIDVATADYQSAINDGEAAIALFPDKPMLHFFTAIAYRQQKNNEKALKYLQTAARFETSDKNLLSQIYSTLGDVYNSLKQYSESDKAYELALHYDANSTYTLNNWAYYLSLRGENLEKAAEMSLRSNQLEPGNSSFEDTYAWVLFKMKHFSDAKSWIEKAINNDSRNSGALREHYGDILYLLGENDKALEQWKKARERGINTPGLERKINEKKYFD